VFERKNTSVSEGSKMTKSSNPPHHECPNLMETTMTGGYSWRIYFNRSMKSKNQKRMSRSMQQAEDMG